MASGSDADTTGIVCCVWAPGGSVVRQVSVPWHGRLSKLWTTREEETLLKSITEPMQLKPKSSVCFLLKLIGYNLCSNRSFSKLIKSNQIVGSNWMPSLTSLFLAFYLLAWMKLSRIQIGWIPCMKLNNFAYNEIWIHEEQPKGARVDET